MMEVATATLLGPAALLISEGGTPIAPTGNRDRASAPSGVYPCADGHVYIYGGLDPYWAKLGPLVGGRVSTLPERMAQVEEFDSYVTSWTSSRPQAAVLDAMARLGIPAGPVRNPVDALALVRGLRPGAVSRALPSGEHVPAYPAMFDGERIERRPTPPVGGGRRSE